MLARAQIDEITSGLAGMDRARVRASMRWLVVVALLSGRAFAQAPEPTAEPPPPPQPPAQPQPQPQPQPRAQPQPQPEPPPKPEPPQQPKSEKATDVPAVDDGDRGFRFGSYGRVLAGTDLRGGQAEKLLIVAHGPRVVEDAYLELETSYGFKTDRGIKLRPLITLAFEGSLFHENGQFDSHPALRNLLLEATFPGASEVSWWVGSRMYRGDDIYLFDFWPLDNQNTLGGGLLYRHKITTNALELAAHAGVNRLLVPFQYQQIAVPNPAQGATTVVQLNRQRMIASATAAYIIDRGPGNVSVKLKVHGQVHGLVSGTFKRDDGTFQALPSDTGMLVGSEVSLFGMQDPGEHRYRRHLNFFARYAKGLAAFDELAPPTTFGPDLTTQRASELSFGMSGNWDSAMGNMMIGGLSRRFMDATGNTVDPANGWEYAIDARPLGRVAPDWFVGADVSYQARFPKGLNPNTLRAEDPAIFQLAPMVVFSPMGPSAYDRPQLRVVYRVAHLNDGALDDYVPDDPRHAHAWVHYLGLQAEWWFNSSTYR